MTIATISPKFQVVIPKEIRRTLGLKPGQRINFIEKDGRIELSPILTPDQLLGFLKDQAHLAFEREKSDRPLP
jgi:AbrB family looped-hinge helix DNA binding protein